MALDLPTPSTSRLRRSPLERVICQVRHEKEMSTTDPKHALRVREQLGSAYPSFDEISGHELSVMGGSKGIQSVQQNESRGGWKFTSVNQDWTISVTPESFSLETTNYLDWDDFSDRLQKLVAVVDETFDLQIEKRIGLRYIDRLTRADTPRLNDWRGWVQDSLLGPVTDQNLGNSIASIQGAFVIHADDGYEATVRHGAVQESASRCDYMIDIDCSRAVGRTLEPTSVMQSAEKLHTLALQLFQASITEQLFNELLGSPNA